MIGVMDSSTAKQVVRDASLVAYTDDGPDEEKPYLHYQGKRHRIGSLTAKVLEACMIELGQLRYELMVAKADAAKKKDALRQKIRKALEETA
jgi:hypothetical protein